MANPLEEPSGDPIEDQCVEWRRRLEELLGFVDDLDGRIENAGGRPEEQAELQAIKERYSRDALAMMMKLDQLEDPEEE